MPLIHIKTARLEYKFEINGKYTVIKGDSGTGKTSFYELAESITNHSKAVQNISGAKLIAVPVNFEMFKFDAYTDCIFVIDESCSIFKRYDVATILQNSDNYFIIINRSMKLGYLPIHVDNVFYIKTSGKFHTLERLYQRFCMNDFKNIDTIITEDHRSGYLFVKDLLSIFHLNHIIIEPAYGSEEDRKKAGNKAGASKIAKSIEYYAEKGRKDIVVIYDACAFASYVDLLLETIRKYNNINIYVLDWESFEGYILESKMFQMKFSLKNLDYSYESLEQFLTEKISEKLKGYSKDKLHKCLKRTRCELCKDGTGCSYRKFKYEDLVYDEIRLIYDFIAGNDEESMVEMLHSE